MSKNYQILALKWRPKHFKDVVGQDHITETLQKAFEKNDLMPRRYVLDLTNLCNLSCTFCFQERKKREDRMTTENWLNVLDQIPKNSRITLTGGDPFMFKDFEKIFKRANEVAETKRVPVARRAARSPWTAPLRRRAPTR